MEAALDVMDPDFRYKSALVLSQQRFIQSLVSTFERDHNMMTVYRRLFTSNWYRIKGLKAAQMDDPPDEAYSGLGRHGTVTPEEYMRRIEAVYGEPWPLRHSARFGSWTAHQEELYHIDFFTRTDSGLRNNGNIRGRFDYNLERLDDNFAAFFGGIDFQNNLKRAEQMDSIMSLVATRVANEFACLAVYPDLQKQPADRRFFGELSGVNGRDGLPVEADLRATMVSLFIDFWALRWTHSQDVELALGLWQEVQQATVDSRDSRCRSTVPSPVRREE